MYALTGLSILILMENRVSNPFCGRRRGEGEFGDITIDFDTDFHMHQVRKCLKSADV
jgi:hypothetical protein